MAKAVAMRYNETNGDDAARVVRRLPKRGVKTILVVGLSLPTMRAIGRLIGKHFYIDKAVDAAECIERVNNDDLVAGIVINPALSEIEASSFAATVRKRQSDLPIFFYGSAQDINSISLNPGPEVVQYFRNPSEICKMAEAIVVRLSDGTVEPDRHPKDTIVSRALEFIEANYQTIKKVEDISNHVGVSREHLSRQFTRYAGHKLSEFVNIYRIEKAKELLMEGGLVKQVFSQVGFRCNSSFFKAFLKHAGTAPSVYKDTVLAKKQGRKTR